MVKHPSAAGQTSPGTVQALLLRRPRKQPQQEPPRTAATRTGNVRSGQSTGNRGAGAVTVRDSKHNLGCRPLPGATSGSSRMAAPNTCPSSPSTRYPSRCLRHRPERPGRYDGQGKPEPDGQWTGAFSPADSVAVFTYNKFIASARNSLPRRGTRLPRRSGAVQATGRDPGNPDQGGPLSVGPHHP